MIDGVGKSGPGRIDLGRSAPGSGAAAVRPGQPAATERAAEAGGTVAEIAAAGAPVDSEKVAAIRAAILAGQYPVDPVKIAERMIALDLPAKA